MRAQSESGWPSRDSGALRPAKSLPTSLSAPELLGSGRRQSITLEDVSSSLLSQLTLCVPNLLLPYHIACMYPGNALPVDMPPDRLP